MSSKNVRRATQDTLPMTLLSRFAPVVEVVVNPDEFIFSTSGRSLPIATRLWVVSGRNGPKITAVGSAPSDSSGEVVELFARNTTPREAELRPDLLAKFVSYGIVTALNRSITLKPRVVFRNVASLDPFLSGYQKPVLVDAASHAGPTTVEFQP